MKIWIGDLYNWTKIVQHKTAVLNFVKLALVLS